MGMKGQRSPFPGNTQFSERASMKLPCRHWSPRCAGHFLAGERAAHQAGSSGLRAYIKKHTTRSSGVPAVLKGGCGAAHLESQLWGGGGRWIKNSNPLTT